MSDSHEPTGARIVPLFPYAPRAEGKPAAPSSQTWSPASQELVDRLLNIDAIGTLSAEHDEHLLHLRAAELGMSSGALYPHVATEDIPAHAARLEFRSIEVMLQTVGEYQPAFIDLLAAAAREAGVRIRSLHTMAGLHPFMTGYARRTDEARALFSLGIQAAATVGADVLVWHGPRRNEVSSAEGWEQFIAITRDLTAECAAADVTLAIENVSACALSQVRDVVRFAKRLDEIGPEQAIGFTFDPFQAMEARANPFMMLAAMGNRVVNAHLSDFSHANPLQRHLPPGDGDIPWSAMIRAIVGSGYQGPLIIEGPLGTGMATVDRVREHLNPHIRNVYAFSPDPTTDDLSLPATLPDGVREGIALFNRRSFFEQHEVIEAEWHAERRPIRRMYQGILQIGVGFHHALRGNHSGALALLTSGTEKLAAWTPSTLGIDIARLIRETLGCIEQLEALGPQHIAAFDASLIPIIYVDDDIVESVRTEPPADS